MGKAVHGRYGGLPWSLPRGSLPLCPVVIFFSALAAVDKHAVLLSESSRHKALIASADAIRLQPADQTLALQWMTDDFALRASEGQLAYLTPLDLLKAAAAQSDRAIGIGLTSVGVALDSLLSSIETKIPAPDLSDEPPATLPQSEEKYSVVIEGPGFRDDRNRYATLEVAQRAARALECLIRGEEIVLESDAPPFGISRPPHLQRATRVYITESS